MGSDTSHLASPSWSIDDIAALLDFGLMIEAEHMTTGSIRLKIKLIIFSGIGAGMLSVVSGWNFAFVWYMIAIIFLVIAVGAWVFSEVLQTRR